MVRVIMVLLIPALLFGCGVSQQVYDEREAEITSLKSALKGVKEERNSLEKEKEKLLDDIVGANERIKMLKKDDKEATAALKIKDSQLNKAEAEINTLKAEVEDLKQAQVLPSEELNEATMRIAQLEEQLAEAKSAQEPLNELKEQLAKREEIAEALREKLANAVGDSALVSRSGDRVTVTIPGDLLFDELSVDVLPSGSAVVKKVAELLKDGSERISIVGHTDDVPVGPSHRVYWRSNWELSAERAGALVRYLQWGPGISPERLEAVGRAHYDPISKGGDEEAKAKNRRVELVITQP
ncbi:MAG: hypothetical protein C0608_01840 [Deltaproteobacteria bacterium]|nr:MAG: hypothetical protein C0608_01840 [Deltaproteobacteria bacterium]